MNEEQSNINALNVKIDRSIDVLTQCYASAEAAHLINPDKLGRDDMIAMVLKTFGEALIACLAKEGLAGMVVEPPCVLALAAVVYLHKHPEAREDFKL